MSQPMDELNAASAAPQSSRMPPTQQRVSVWRTVLGCEWLLLRRDPAWWVALAVLVGCVVFAMASGQQRLTERRLALQAAQQDEKQRLDRQAQELQRLLQSGTAFRGEAFRDPGNPLSVGRGAAAPVVSLADAPLAALAVGLSDLYPASFRVAVGSRDRFLFVDEIANPSSLAGGVFDAAFVVVYLFPLLLLALSYNLWSGEREQGTWALTQASSAPLFLVLAAKLAVRGGCMTLVLLATLALWLQPAASAWWGSVLLVAAVATYAGFWMALALWVNSWQRSSGFNAVALVSCWLLALVVVPAAINAVSAAVHPAPARADMVLAVREAAVDAERDRDAEMARFRLEHGTAALPANAAESRRLAVLLAADQRADSVLERHEAMVRQQRTLSDGLAFLSPAVLMNDALAELAGTGQTRWDRHLEGVAAFHRRWQAFFVERAQRGARIATDDARQWPRWEPVAAAAPDRSASARVAVAVLWTAALAAVLAGLAGRRLTRAD